MPIEFACSHCDSYLRTPDDRQGLQIRCPVCEEAIWVPTQESPSHISTETDEAEWEPEIPPAAARAVSHGRVELSLILSDTWYVYHRNLRQCLIAALLDIAASIFAVVLATLLTFGTLFALAGVHPGSAVLCAAIVWLIGITVTYSAITVGNFRYYIALARGQSVRPGMMLVNDLSVSRLIIGWLVFWTISGVGVLAMVVPGVVAMIFLWPFAAVLVDQKVSVAEAMRISIRITSRNFATAAAVFFLHILLLILAAMTTPVGHLIALPLATIMHSVAYLHLSGEYAEGGTTIEEWADMHRI